MNRFTYFWCFLEFVIGKFIPNINNEHAQDYSCPGATFTLCSHGEKLPRQGGLPGVIVVHSARRVTRCYLPLEVALGQRKTDVNSYRRQTVHQGKVDPGVSEAMFTLYRIVKRSVAESAPDRASVHIRNAAFEAVSAPEQYCSAPLLKVERSVSDRFLRRSESSLNTFIEAEIATEPRIGKLSFQIKRERWKLHNE